MLINRITGTTGIIPLSGIVAKINPPMNLPVNYVEICEEASGLAKQERDRRKDMNRYQLLRKAVDIRDQLIGNNYG